MAEGSKKVVYAAMAGNGAIAVSKFIASMITGSSAMLSEAIHSTVDLGDSLMLLTGLRRSNRPPDELHPFGHGKELYFWTLIVSISIFGLGGGLSVYEGIEHIVHPPELGSPLWNYVVLSLAALFEGGSLAVAIREFRKSKPDRYSFFEYFRASKDPTVFTTVMEDTLALIGITIAFLGVTLSDVFGMTWADGGAAILIGLLLMSGALFLANESKNLLVGESADQKQVEEIRKVIQADPEVSRVGKLLTMQLAPEEVLLLVEIEFADKLSSDGLERATKRIEGSIREKHSSVKRIFLEADSLERTA